MRISNKLSVDTPRCGRIILKTAAILLVCCQVVIPATLYGKSDAGTGSAVREVSQQPVTVTGTVTDESGEPLPGVSITLKTPVKSDRVIGNVTDYNGKYTFTGLKAGDRLVFSFIGMETLEVVIKQGQTLCDVVLKSTDTQLNEVVVKAGIIQRNKVGFTGAYSSVAQEELKAVGNINILQSLKSIDPSFVISDNLSAGSNPNVMANVEVRGQTSMSISSVQDEASASANRPLFILDGFEATLTQINDLDINRVESMTILKDAGSTAIYGAKGANGVVVIETVKPKAGEIMIRYNGDMQFSFADLSVYNMMNAAEKLEFEKLALRWGTITDTSNILGQREYYRRLALVESGVDTYWLSEPVRNSFTHSHSVSASGGGKNSLLFDIGVNYKDNEGVMKDSRRETYGGNFKLVYRGLNKLNITNNATVSGSNAHDGSWGSFSDFVKAIPYFRKRNEDGTIPRYLDAYTTNPTQTTASTTEYAYNPLYNAMLNTRTDDRYFYFTNNTAIDWYVNSNLRLSGALSLNKTTRDYQYFKDPRHSSYTNTVYTKKGTYTGTKMNSWSYSANVSASYARSFNKVHNLTLIGRASAQESNKRAETYTAEGFPEGSEGYPSQAYSYTEGSRPSYAETTDRDVSFLTAFNYNYDYRYLLDFNYNLEGTTTFGSNKKFHDFWSVGLGWNIDREAFARDWEWLSAMKLSGAIGTNANQNINLLTSSVYTYYSGNTQFGQGSKLSQFANPNLEWQKVTKKALSLESDLFENRLKVTIGLYDHHTNPLIVNLAQLPSSGVGTYPLNMGFMDSRGVDFTLLYFPVYNVKENILLSIRLTGAHGKEKYGGYGNALERLNESFLSESTPENLLSLQKYTDGKSPHDIWAVKSLGIDPATGREVFLTEEGKQTFIYDAEDRVVVGNTKPDMEGVVGINLIYKKLQFNSIFRYRIGADAMNTALYNKVENITKKTMIYNQDKRALYDRWKQAGDIAQFVSINTVAQGNPLSSRFVQRDNQLICEAVKISWDFSGDKWLRSLLLKEFKTSISANDIFRINSMKMERGTDYPFARSITLNLTARF